MQAPAAVDEEVLNHPEETADRDADPQLLVHFASERVTGNVVQVGTATGEDPEVVPLLRVQEDVPSLDTDTDDAVIELTGIVANAVTPAGSWSDRECPPRLRSG